MAHKEAKTKLSGDASGTRVRVGQQAQLFQRGQFIANRSGTHAQFVLVDNGRAANRLGSLDILLDHNAQHLALAVGQRIEGQ